MNSFTLGAWIPLSAGRGTRFAADENRIAAAELARLVVWENRRVIKELDAPAQEPGWPRFAGRYVLWGEGTLDLTTGVYRRAPGLAAALLHDAAAPTDAPPGGGYRPAAYGWSSDGEALVVSTAWGGTEDSFPARALLLDREGRHRRTLWQGFELAPKALWAGRRSIAIGTHEPRVYDRQGDPLATLDGGTPIRIEACRDESTLLIVEHGRLSLWSTSSWTRSDVLEGNWLDAAIAPDGGVVAMVDFEGQLFLARVADRLSSFTGIPLPDPARSVALGQDGIVAGFARGEAIRVADLVCDA